MVLRCGQGKGGFMLESQFLLFGILRQAQPQLRHAEPMGLRFQGGRGTGKREAALGAGSELVG